MPIRHPFNPGRLNERAGRFPGWIGEHRAGVGPPGLMRTAPLHDGTHLGPFVLHASGRDQQLSAEHQLRRAHRRRAVAVAQARHVTGTLGLTQQVDPGVAIQAGRHVRPVSTGVHAHGAAHRSRHTHRPGQARPPAIGHLAGQHREGHRPARPDHQRFGPGVAGLGKANGVESAPQPYGHAVKSGIRDQKIRAAADHDHRQPAPSQGEPDGVQILGIPRLDEECGRSADAVRRQGAQRLIPRRP